MANEPIPVSIAISMMEEYILYMRAKGIDMEKQTHSISFTSKELMTWLNETMPVADELRVCLGAYGKNESNAGRITVILWPYKDGQPTMLPFLESKDAPSPTPPYNTGGLNP